MSDRPARTAHFTNAWHGTSGGIRTFYSALIERAERDARSMTLVVPGDRDGVIQEGAHTRIETIASPHVLLVDSRYRAVMPHRYVFRRRGAIWDVLAARRPDVVEVSDKFTLCHLAGLIKRRSGPRPTVIGLSQERLDDTLAAQTGRAPAARAFARWYMRSVYLRQFDAHFANSEYTAHELRTAASSRGPGARLHWRLRDRIHVLPLGADTGAFRPSLRSEALRESLLVRAGGTAQSVVVLYGGRLSAEKGVDQLVPAVRMATGLGVDARLVVVGDGPERAALERDAAAYLAGRYVFLGHIGGRDDLARIVAAADCFLHPNAREPFGIAPLEAMASGVPLVAPGSGGVLSYACEQTAWLTRPGGDALGTAIHAVVTRPDEARCRALAGVARARSFTWAAVAHRYFAAYDAIDAARRREPPIHAASLAPIGVDPAGTA